MGGKDPPADRDTRARVGAPRRAVSLDLQGHLALSSLVTGCQAGRPGQRCEQQCGLGSGPVL